jgi:membrane protein YdbS with pleckstrin-like domain
MIPIEIKNILIEFSNNNFFKISIVAVCLILAFMSILIFHMPKDNSIEQIAEEVIKLETGIDVDLVSQNGEK